MKKVLLASASALAIVTGSAFAADVVPEPAPVPDWTAFHIGVGGGGGWNLYDAESQFCHDDGSACEDGDLEDADLILNLSADDMGKFYGLGTIEVGFDYQIPDTPIVFGVVGSWDFMGDSQASVDDNITGNGDDHLNNELKAELDDNAWFLGGRVGFAFWNNSSLAYVLGGYTWVDGRVESKLDFEDFEDDHSGAGDAEQDDNVDGWALGGGLETMLWENLSLKVEYRHDFLDDIEFDEVGVNDDGSPDFDETHTGKVDFSRDTVRAVLSWRLGNWFQ